MSTPPTEKPHDPRDPRDPHAPDDPYVTAPLFERRCVVCRSQLVQRRIDDAHVLVACAPCGASYSLPIRRDARGDPFLRATLTFNQRWHATHYAPLFTEPRLYFVSVPALLDMSASDPREWRERGCSRDRRMLLRQLRERGADVVLVAPLDKLRTDTERHEIGLLAQDYHGELLIAYETTTDDEPALTLGLMRDRMTRAGADSASTLVVGKRSYGMNVALRLPSRFSPAAIFFAGADLPLTLRSPMPTPPSMITGD